MDDDGKSLEEDGMIAGIDEREVEERAVVDFVSEIELDHGSIKLRGEQEGDEEGETMNNHRVKGGKEDDELSQQCSLDDVSGDDEDVVADDVGDEQDGGSRQEETAAAERSN